MVGTTIANTLKRAGQDTTETFWRLVICVQLELIKRMLSKLSPVFGIMFKSGCVCCVRGIQKTKNGNNWRKVITVG